MLSTHASRLDMGLLGQPGALQTLGFCVLPLRDIWSGRRHDVVRERFEVVQDNDDMTHVATVTVSLLAEAALRTLRAAQQQQTQQQQQIQY